MKSVKIFIFTLFVTLLLSNCELFIINPPEQTPQPPALPSTENFTIPLDKFDTICGGENNLNHDLAAKLAMTWHDNLSEFRRIIDLYAVCQQSNGQHFGGDTWYWQVYFSDSVFELYATNFSDNEILIEAYINPRVDQGNSDSTHKVLEGYFFPEKQNGNFTLYSKEIQLTINWTNEHIVYYLDDNSTEKQLTFKLENNLYHYKFIQKQNSDTVYVLQSIDENWGKIKNFQVFRDYDWHCWDNDYQNTDCDNLPYNFRCLNVF